MDTDRQSLPLFPLNLVLFPESQLTLHIFEERYKTMIRQCWKDETEFGVNLYENNYLHPVGCTARIEGILRSYPDGSFDILIVGTARYRLIDYHTTATGYYQGAIEVFRDTHIDVPEALVSKALAMVNQIIDMAYPGKEDLRLARESRDISLFSYAIAEKAGIELQDRQRLLEHRSWIDSQR
jgi:Lon protease-like protein